MKDKKSTKMFAERNRNFYNLLKDNINDIYFLEVLYYYLRRALQQKDFNLQDVSGLKFNGRYLGYELFLDFSEDYDTTLKSLGLLLSIRAFMIDSKYFDRCYNDEFLFYDLDTNYLLWDSHRTIVECLDDEDFKFVYDMVLHLKGNNKLSDGQIEQFKSKTIRPEYRNQISFCKMKAADPEYNGKSIIKNCAYLYADFNTFTVPENVDYVGDTAFAYCNNLETITFTKRVYFGYFPIIECNNLRQIIVPLHLVDYYKQALPHYKDIVSDHEQEKQEIENIKPEDCSEPICVANEVEPAQSVTIQQPDFSKIKTIFDNKTTTYKYFWFLSIISLAKEKGILYISFKELVIRMAAMAWPIVFENGIDLGKTDRLSKILSEVEKTTKLISAATSTVVEKYLLQHYQSQGVDRILAPLMKNVPYRFLSPWIKYTTDDEVVEESNKRDSIAMYAISDNAIILNEDWWDYISDNYVDICNSTMKSFTEYVKQFNDGMKLLKLKTEGFSFIGK